MPALFGPLFRDGWHIKFAYRTFPWNSEAPGKAAVHCVITGYTRDERAHQRLFEYDWTAKTHQELKVKTGINAYLLDAPNVLITKRSKPLSPELPAIKYGIKPADGGNLIIASDEIQEFNADPIAMKYVRPYKGAKELIRDSQRWCLWFENLSPEDLKSSSLLKRRIDSCRDWRTTQISTGDAYKLRDTPHLMRLTKDVPRENYVCIPRHFSENRKYATVRLYSPEVISGDANFTVLDPDGFVFAIISSSMFMTWQKAVGGRIKSDYRFSNTIVWNNLPLPAVEPKLREQIIEAGRGVLAAREAIAERAGGTRSLADMYNPLAMDKGLLDAHKKLDRLVDKAFGAPKLCTSETQRLETLFNRFLEL